MMDSPLTELTELGQKLRTDFLATLTTLATDWVAEVEDELNTPQLIYLEAELTVLDQLPNFLVAFNDQLNANAWPALTPLPSNETEPETTEKSKQVAYPSSIPALAKTRRSHFPEPLSTPTPIAPTLSKLNTPKPDQNLGTPPLSNNKSETTWTSNFDLPTAQVAEKSNPSLDADEARTPVNKVQGLAALVESLRFAELSDMPDDFAYETETFETAFNKETHQPKTKLESVEEPKNSDRIPPTSTSNLPTNNSRTVAINETLPDRKLAKPSAFLSTEVAKTDIQQNADLTHANNFGATLETTKLTDWAKTVIVQQLSKLSEKVSSSAGNKIIFEADETSVPIMENGFEEEPTFESFQVIKSAAENLDMDTILELLVEEIRRDYKRYYGN